MAAAPTRLIALVHPFFMNGGFHRSPRPSWPAEFLTEATEALALLFDQICDAIEADR
ncbi:hypothetical protein [Sphingobium sp. RAC03]|uniref:hypothetical protein n=1 Tax=Sphingobium sp. RAC03 TaxID=1843368 RepID=UPI001495915B|nr:hypothetical protein [Sphingobium sp. RAC03]